MLSPCPQKRHHGDNQVTYSVVQNTVRQVRPCCYREKQVSMSSKQTETWGLSTQCTFSSLFLEGHKDLVTLLKTLDNNPRMLTSSASHQKEKSWCHHIQESQVPRRGFSQGSPIRPLEHTGQVAFVHCHDHSAGTASHVKRQEVWPKHHGLRATVTTCTTLTSGSLRAARKEDALLSSSLYFSPFMSPFCR